MFTPLSVRDGWNDDAALPIFEKLGVQSYANQVGGIIDEHLSEYRTWDWISDNSNIC